MRRDSLGTSLRPVLTVLTVLTVLALMLLSACGGDRDAGSVTVSRDYVRRLAAGVLHENAVDPGNRSCRRLLGAGWLGPERTADGTTFAWTTAPTAEVRLPVAVAGAGQLRLTGYGLAGPDGPQRLEIRVNGASLGTRELPDRLGTVTWPVPAHRLRAGLNALELRVARTTSPRELGVAPDDRPLGVLVDWIAFVPDGAAPGPDPYAAEETTTLGPGRVLTARLSHAAGAELDLDWPPGAPAPEVAVAAAPGGAPLFRADVKADSGWARVVLPVDLPGGSWLDIRGDGGALEGVRLLRQVRPRDVILIIVDTLRPDYLGCYGAGPDASPAIDRLAEEGILFRRAFSQAPMTGPSHASLFTSHLPSETGMTTNGRTVLPPSLPTLAEILRDSGWSTGAAVAIGPLQRQFGFARGFDRYNDRLDDLWILRADTMAGRIDRVRRGLAEPAFLFAHYADPHEPYDAHGLVTRSARVSLAGRGVATLTTSTYLPRVLELDVPAGRHRLVITSDAPFHVRNLAATTLAGRVDVDTAGVDADAWTEFSTAVSSPDGGRIRLVLGASDVVGDTAALRARYAREVTFADRWVGALLDSLRAAGRWDDSLVIFAADHGESLDEHGLRGHVQNLHDTLTHVPLIIKPPRGTGGRPGTRRDDVAALVDVLPTVLAAAGLPPLPGARGRDLLADGAADVEAVAFAETHRPEARHNYFGLRTAHARVIHDPDAGTWAYYDLDADPGELRDAAADDTAAFRRDRALLEAILASLHLGDAKGAGDVAVDARTAEMLRSLGY